MLDGKLYSIGDTPAQLQFQIETSMGTGKMTAQNPKTGESFTGQYTGIRHGNTLTFETPKAKPAITPPSYATARGILIGDKGTAIELFMEIKPGLRPTGHGEGSDNKGNRYQVQF